jgi:integrase/recombinase XerC
MKPAALEALQRFARHLANERRLSPHTGSAYQRDLDALAAWCDTQGIADWKKLDHGHVRSFAARSHAAGLGPRSIQRRLSATRSFFSFLQREGLATHNPAGDVRAPKSPKRLPRTADADQMSRLMDSPADSPLQQRDVAIMELLYSSGLRLAELVGLDTDALDLADRTVRVTGKGRKTRVVPVGRKAITALHRWLAARATLAAVGETAVFVGRNGKRAPAGPAGEGASAPVPPLLCHAPAGVQPGPARRAGIAGPCRHQHHTGVYPPGLPAPGTDL